MLKAKYHSLIESSQILTHKNTVEATSLKFATCVALGLILDAYNEAKVLVLIILYVNSFCYNCFLFLLIFIQR